MSRFVLQATWDDAPHLSQEQKDELWAGIPEYQREARSKGLPIIGSGAIYPISDSDIEIDDFEIPGHWGRAYALDVGWTATAALWGAYDKASDTIFFYSEYKRGEAEPPSHAQAVMSRGEWMSGVIDPTARNRAQKDGIRLMQQYRAMGLDLIPANNAVEAGLLEVWTRMSTGRLKVFKSLQGWFAEKRIYRRDEKGNIVKKFDHYMDCLHPNTIVITKKGSIPIKDLVGTEGKVLSIGGKWEKYKNCRLISKNKKIVRISFDDGSHVLCTPDHKFLTSQGWVNAIDMHGKDCYNAVSQTIERRNLCKSNSYQKKGRSLVERFIISAGFTTKEPGLDCIGNFGNTIMVRFQKAYVFIIKMAIEPIIQLKIYLLNQGQNILHTTKKVIQDLFHPKHLKLQSLGMEVAMGLNGTSGIMIPTAKTRCIKKRSLFANIVEKNTSKQLTGRIDFAQTIASRHTEESLELTMKKGSVLSAGPVLKLTNTPRQLHAQENVLVNVLDVQDAGRSNVYCLDVPKTHAFAVNSGVIVHNCMRYFCMSAIPRCISPAEVEEMQEFEYQSFSMMGNRSRCSVTGY